LADVALRRAGHSDVPRLAALLSDCYLYYGAKEVPAAEELTRRLRRRLNAEPGFEALLIEHDGQTLGFAIYAPVFWTGDCEIALFLKEVFVVESARGLGIGRRLMAELSRIARRRGWSRVIWTVDRKNRPAKLFYASLSGARMVSKDVYMLDNEAMQALADRA
jgi:GNAT superfamily N-acetyltransferase